MNSLRFGLIAYFTMFAGCASPKQRSTTPSAASGSVPSFLKQMDTVDEIQVAELTLDDRRDISRFLSVCQNARWAPYMATMPADIETIGFMSGGVERHRLVYAGGWGFDTSGSGAPRFGTIHSDDSAWVDEHIDTQLMLIRNAL